MIKIKNFIEAHKMSKCNGSYRRGVVFNNNICRMFINFTNSKMDKHNEDFSQIYYAGRGKKDKSRYFVEDTIDNKENAKMLNNKTPFPIYVRLEEGYYHLGLFKIVKVVRKSQYNPNLNKKFKTIGFICNKI